MPRPAPRRDHPWRMVTFIPAGESPRAGAAAERRRATSHSARVNSPTKVKADTSGAVPVTAFSALSETYPPPAIARRTGQDLR